MQLKRLLDCPAELSSEPDVDEIESFHYYVAGDAIIAAAMRDKHQPSNLRILTIEGASLEPVFAFGDMLPAWLWLAHWDVSDGIWASVAQMFRPLIAHASRWLDTAHDRLLTTGDVQRLRAYFAEHGIPDCSSAERDVTEPIAAARFLPFLEKNQDMAAAIASLWNEGVELGEADFMACGCDMCVPRTSNENDEEEEEEEQGVWSDEENAAQEAGGYGEDAESSIVHDGQVEDSEL